MSNPMTLATSDEAFDVAAAIAPELTPRPMTPQRVATIKLGVVERIRRSALAHRDLATVRREDAAWAAASPGVQRCALSAGAGLRVDLVQLEPGVMLPWLPDAQAQEVLVLKGSLALQAAAQRLSQLQRLSQRVLPRDSTLSLTAESEGATLYVRSRTADLGQLPGSEAQWWNDAQAQTLSAAGLAGDLCPWSALFDGADAAVLHAHGNVASMLLRIAPGAQLPDHDHELDEDCYMLEGDMFLGDILMRAGDYQLARAGGRHVGIASDAGGLFYFHGALPPGACESP